MGCEHVNRPTPTSDNVSYVRLQVSFSPRFSNALSKHRECFWAPSYFGHGQIKTPSMRKITFRGRGSRHGFLKSSYGILRKKLAHNSQPSRRSIPLPFIVPREYGKQHRSLGSAPGLKPDVPTSVPGIILFWAASAIVNLRPRHPHNVALPVPGHGPERSLSSMAPNRMLLSGI